jgi:hypothetical protein
MTTERTHTDDMTRRRIELDGGSHIVLAPSRSATLHFPDGGRFEIHPPMKAVDGEAVPLEWTKWAKAAWEAYSAAKKLAGQLMGSGGSSSSKTKTCTGTITTGTDANGLPTATVTTSCSYTESSSSE